MEINLFRELCETHIDEVDQFLKTHGEASQLIDTTLYFPALVHLRTMADNATIDRVIKKLRAERQEAMKEIKENGQDINSETVDRGYQSDRHKDA